MYNILCTFNQIFYKYMRFNYLNQLIALLSLFFTANSQSIQIKFCGKCTAVVPAKDNNGNDQRHKGGIRMDLIRIGKIGQSHTSPFYSLGIAPLSFKDGTWVDGCTNNMDASYCTGCTSCKKIQSTSGAEVGTSEGLMNGNMRMRTLNDDLFIESTGNQNLVCFTTNPIDLSGYQGKFLEVNVIYEGTAQDGFMTVNTQFNYKYNNGAWTNMCNQNSNFLRIIDTALLVGVKVPSAVNNLDAVVDFVISPNPVSANLNIELNSQKTFYGSIAVRDILGKLITEQQVFIQEGENRMDIHTQNLESGFYLFQLSDKEGKISTRKFVKN
jgi:hypothetical protein